MGTTTFLFSSFLFTSTYKHPPSYYVDVESWQLFGGIQRYMEQFPEGGFFKGKNFVFDHRYDFFSNLQNPLVYMLI